MDSDAELTDPKVIDRMKERMDRDVYGVGYVIKRKDIDYLHPFFAMIRRKSYMQYHPFIDHGAPFCRAMFDIHGKMRVVNIMIEGNLKPNGRH